MNRLIVNCSNLKYLRVEHVQRNNPYYSQLNCNLIVKVLESNRTMETLWIQPLTKFLEDQELVLEALASTDLNTVKDFLY